MSLCLLAFLMYKWCYWCSVIIIFLHFLVKWDKIHYCLFMHSMYSYLFLWIFLCLCVYREDKHTGGHTCAHTCRGQRSTLRLCFWNQGLSLTGNICLNWMARGQGIRLSLPPQCRNEKNASPEQVMSRGFWESHSGPRVCMGTPS